MSKKKKKNSLWVEAQRKRFLRFQSSTKIDHLSVAILTGLVRLRVYVLILDLRNKQNNDARGREIYMCMREKGSKSLKISHSVTSLNCKSSAIYQWGVFFCIPESIFCELLRHSRASS
jgi:hypothetical protein